MIGRSTLLYWPRTPTYSSRTASASSSALHRGHEAFGSLISPLEAPSCDGGNESKIRVLQLSHWYGTSIKWMRAVDPPRTPGHIEASVTMASLTYENSTWKIP